MFRPLVVAALLAAVTACAPVAVAPPPSSAPSSQVASPPAPSSTDAPAPTSAPAGTQAPTSSPVPPPSTTTPPVPTGKTVNVEITWYGSYDNDPKGSLAIDSPVIHKTAGGTGTYKDPLTFASPVNPDGSTAYPKGAVIYVPGARRYFIREDSCAVSWTAPNGCGAATHVDLYIGNPSSTKAVLKCEEALTPDGLAPIIVDPPADLTVDLTPLWDQATGKCGHLH